METSALTLRVVWLASFVVFLLGGFVFADARSQCRLVLQNVPVAEHAGQIPASYMAKRTNANCMFLPTLSVVSCLMLLLSTVLGWVKGSALNLGGQVEHLYFELDAEGRMRVDNAARLTIVACAFIVTVVFGTSNQFMLQWIRTAERPVGSARLHIMLMCLLMLVAVLFGTRYLTKLMRAEWERSNAAS